MNIKELEQVYKTVILSENVSDQPLSPEEQELIGKLQIKIAGGKVALHGRAPELARILARLKVNVVNSNDPYVKTMAVDAANNIYINPKFGDELSDAEFYGVFAHEALHIANGTFLRKGERDMTLWNIATDAIMNWSLVRDGFKIPAKGIIPDINTGIFEFPDIKKTIKVVDDKGYPISAEEIYKQLEQIKNQIPKQPSQQGQQGQQGQKGQPGQQGQKGQPGQPGQPGQQGEEGDNSEKAAGDYFKKLEQERQTDKHLTNEEAKKVNKDFQPISSEEMKQQEEERRRLLKRGLEDSPKASANRGSGAGGIRSVLQNSIPIVVDWKGVIRRYLTAANSKYTTWLKPSYRGMAGGYQSPGKFTSPNKLDAIFAVDTSGSIGTEELNIAFNFIRDIAKVATNLNVRILLWHSEAYYVSNPIASKGALESTLKNITAQSGGTEMSSIDPLIQKHKLKPVVVIYITDGYVEGSPKFGNYQKVFVIVNQHANNPDVIKGIEAIFKGKGQIVITPTLKND